MIKKVLWLTPDYLVDIFFDEVSRAYLVDGNLMIHIGSTHEEENAEHIIKREKTRLIIPKEKMGKFINDLKELEKFLSHEGKPEEGKKENKEKGPKNRLGRPFPT